jgi:mono/diheme cytochrome c family protein
MLRRSCFFLCVVFQGLQSVAVSQDAAALWSQQVQPLFDQYCVKCHGPLEQHSGLELDSVAAVLRGADGGAVVVPGKPEDSRLFQYLAAESEPHMPPGKQLTEAQQQQVQRWILQLSAALGSQPAAAVPVRSFSSVTEAVDVCVSEGWDLGGVTAARPVTDSVWCRRVYLDLAGRIPTTAELDSFLQSPAEVRRAELVDRLLQSGEYAVRMRELWDVFLMGRPGRNGREDRRRQHGWWSFLEGAFRDNRPWNETVRSLLVARGDLPTERGASWFLYERRNNHQAIAEAVAPLIYGTRIDCAQCHDHPLTRDIRQAHYWGLVTAFNRSKNVDGGAVVSESATGGFVNFTNLKKESQPALMVLLDDRVVEELRPAEGEKQTDGDDLYVDGGVKQVPKLSRRQAFADLAVTGNPRLADAFVNRMWSVLLGRGLVHPVDEMNGRNPASHPELLSWLSRDFEAHGYDVKRLVRGLVLSRPYGLGSVAGGEVPAAAFAAAIERPLTGEQLARSWRVVAGVSAEDDGLRRKVTGALPDVLPREYAATWQQAQFLSGAAVLEELLRPEVSPTAARLSALSAVDERVRLAFQEVWGRDPDADEQQRSAEFFAAHSGDASVAVRDFLWALVTSAEFLTVP